MKLSYQEFLEYLQLIETGLTSVLYELYLDCIRAQNKEDD